MEHEEISETKCNREIFSRCSPSRVYSVVSELNDERKEIVREMGFGSLLGMKKCTLCRDLIHWLLERFDPTEGSLQLRKSKFILDSKIFGKILGVVDGGEEIGDLIMEDSCKRVIGERISLSKLEHSLKKNEMEDSLFVKNFVLFVCGTLLLPSTSSYVVRSLEETLKAINRAKSVSAKNWASLSWRFLVESVRRYKQRHSTFVCGCVYFLQLYYLNELEGHDRYVDKSLCPTNWWTEKETKLVMKWIYDCGGYDKVEVKQRSTEMPLINTIALGSLDVDRLSNEVGRMNSEINILRGELKEDIRMEVDKSCGQLLATVSQVLGRTIEMAHAQEYPNGESMIDRHSLDINCVEESTCLDIELSFDDSLRKLAHLHSSEEPNKMKSKRTMFQMYIDNMCQVVGPFHLNNKIELSNFSIAMHIFLSELSLSEIIFRHQEHKVARLYFGGLLPDCKVDLQVVGAYVITIRTHEMMRYKVGRPCCVVTMPIRKKDGMLLDLHNLQQGKDEIPLRNCAKVIV